MKANLLLKVLTDEKNRNYKGGIYHKTQIQLTYNTNRIEGSRLTEEQTRLIFETKTIGTDKDAVLVNDIIETTNHFLCVKFVIDNALEKLDEGMIKKIHLMLKSGTDDINIGEYKSMPNEVGGEQTVAPENVGVEMKKLLTTYYVKKTKTLEDIICFHQQFEKIHPFQDGNGRVGRLIMLKECLAHNIVPFIIEDTDKFFYYRGLKEWQNNRGFLMDTCLHAQDKYKKWLDYFRIEYS